MELLLGFVYFFWKVLENSTLQGDSPVRKGKKVNRQFPEYCILDIMQEWEASTSNHKYVWRPIEKSTVRESWKEPLIGCEKTLKSNNYSGMRLFGDASSVLNNVAGSMPECQD